MSVRWASKSLKEMEPNPFGAIRQKIQNMKDVVNLSSGDPDFPTPPHIVEAAYKALKEGWTHYTLTNGIPELREEIAKYYRKFEVNVDPEGEIIVTPGSQQALYLTLASILDPGDEVLVSNPSYTVYSPVIKYLKARPVFFPLDRENGFHIDASAIEEKISERTKIILICTPNNPTGTVFDSRDLKVVAKVAEENDLLVISDEIYSEFVWSGRHRSIASLPGMKERTVVIVSFSKTFAMTGWRLGYLIANRKLVGMMLDLQGNMVLCPAGFVQMAGVAALKGSWEPVLSMSREYERRVEYVANRLDELEGVSCQKPEGAFYVWADVSELSESSLSFCEDLIEKKKMVALSGSYFGSNGDGFIRLALVKPMDTLVEAMNRFESYVK
jgi:aspartate/methionine/tyrosine aminotransferase